MDSTNKIPKKIVKIMIQLGDFVGFDVWQRGLYNVQCRLYARDPSSRYARRIDGYPILVTSVDDGVPESFCPFPHETLQRSKCLLPDHRMCSWKCKVTNSRNSNSSLDLTSNAPEDNPLLSDLYVSPTFLIAHQGDRIPLQSVIVFRLEIDDVQEHKAPYVGMDSQDVFIELSLCFTSDETCKSRQDIIPIQTRTLRIRNLLPIGSFAKPILFQYHSIEFDKLYFSSLDVLVSYTYIGFGLSKTQLLTSPNYSNPHKKSFLSWLGKKLGWKSTTVNNTSKLNSKESKYSLKSSLPCHVNDFQGQMWWIEQSLDNLVNLQFIVNQIQDELHFTSVDQLMTTGYVYESVYYAIYQQEKAFPDQSIPITALDSRHILYRQVTLLIKTWIETCFNKEEAESKLEIIVSLIADLCKKVWRSFITDVGLLNSSRVSNLRVIWTRIKNAILCEYILKKQETDLPVPLLIKRIEKSITSHFPYVYLIEDEINGPSPIIIQHYLLGTELSTDEASSTRMSKFSIHRSSLVQSSIGLATSKSNSRQQSFIFPKEISEGGPTLTKRRSSYSQNQPSVNDSIPTGTLTRESSSPTGDNIKDDNASIAGAFAKSIHDDQVSIISNVPMLYIQDIDAALDKIQIQRNDNMSLIVFVHGLFGSSFDFRQYRNRLVKKLFHVGLESTNAVYLVSKSNEGETLEDIEKQGANLAKEIVEFIETHHLKPSKISFICHSLGGLVARYAIMSPTLAPLYDLFYEFVSYGTPHLSLIHHSHSIINSFLGIYQSLQKSKCIDQLYLRDASDPRKSLLYTLAMDKGLTKFKKLRVFGSKQDKYVPFASALIQPDYSKHALYNTIQSTKSLNILSYRLPHGTSTGSLNNQVNQRMSDIVYQEMMTALNKTLESVASFEKYEIGFSDSSPSSKDVLGRKGHLAMVEDEQVLELILLTNRFHL